MNLQWKKTIAGILSAVITLVSITPLRGYAAGIPVDINETNAEDVFEDGSTDENGITEREIDVFDFSDSSMVSDNVAVDITDGIDELEDGESVSLFSTGASGKLEPFIKGISLTPFNDNGTVQTYDPQNINTLKTPNFQIEMEFKETADNLWDRSGEEVCYSYKFPEAFSIGGESEDDQWQEVLDSRYDSVGGYYKISTEENMLYLKINSEYLEKYHNIRIRMVLQGTFRKTQACDSEGREKVQIGDNEFELVFKSNCRIDYIWDTWSFENPSTKIPIQVYLKYFPPITAMEIRKKHNGTDGQCAGMVLSSIASFLGYPAIDSYSEALYSSLNDVKKTDYSTITGCTASEFIQYAYVYQYTKNFAEERTLHCNNTNGEENLNGVCNAVYNFSENGGVPVYISINNGAAGHALLGIKIEEKNRDNVKILVYDCNFPNEKSYLYLYGSNEIYTSWSYRTWSSDDENSFISYILKGAEFIDAYKPDPNHFTDWMSSLSSIRGDSNTEISYAGNKASLSEANLGKLEGMLPIGNDNGGDTGELNLYWATGDTSEIQVSSPSSDVRVLCSRNNSGVEAVAGVGSEISIDFDNQNVKIGVDEDEDFLIKYSSSQDTLNINEVEISGKTTGIVEAKQNSGEVEISGAKQLEISFKESDGLNGDAETEKKSEINISNLIPDHLYNISVEENESKNEIVMSEDTNGDGNFDTVIATSVPVDIGSPSIQILVPDQNYIGLEVTPTPVVIDGERQLIKDIDYTVQYENNQDPGTAKVIITGIGTYTGTVAREFEIICEHQYGSWEITRTATVFRTGKKQCVCAICGYTRKKTIAKLEPTVTLSMKTIPLKVKQSTTAFKVSGLAKGDSVKSYKSSNTRIAVINSKGKITAKRSGTAKITVTLKSGKKATATVKVQKSTVKTKKLKVNKTKLTLKKGKRYTLKATLTPLTSQQKVTYTSSNKSIAVVNSKGRVVAKKKGKAKITVTSGSKKVVVTVTVK